MLNKFTPLNMDYTKTLIKSADEYLWVASPVHGITRVQLEREQSESGCATSLVRYAPNAQFPMHGHPGGEQFYVLEGTFSDHTGHYSAGTYVQNPIDSTHNPFSKEGALIFVRLGAIEKGFKKKLVISDLGNQSTNKIQTGQNDYIALHSENCGARFVKNNIELLLLEGKLIDSQSREYKPLSWFRIAAQDYLELVAATPVKYLQRPLLR